jgi:hypothetical protein
LYDPRWLFGSIPETADSGIESAVAICTPVRSLAFE